MLAGTYCFVSSFNQYWLLDTGATDHICCKLENFDTYYPLKGENNFITIPDGRRVKATHKGTIQINELLQLNHVLFVPDFQYNLISVHNLCKDFGCSVVFTDGQCYIQDLFWKGQSMPLGKQKQG
ncbi:Retrovirus-related Pol polyprotein from transposon RE2 [Bienertia sinuspersici]